MGTTQEDEELRRVAQVAAFQAMIETLIATAPEYQGVNDGED